MRHTLRITVGVALLVACQAGRTQAADAARDVAAKATGKSSAANASVADKLVREALEAELAGDAAERARLLTAAIHEDAGNASARWHSGQLKVDKSWLSVNDAASHFAADARLREYRRRRESLVDTVDGQRELARWCQRSQLPDEAAVHWQAVLSFAPEDAEAIRVLKLKMHSGRLLNPRELAAAEACDSREKEAARKWQPQIIKWRDAIVEGDASQRQAAIDGLKSIRDPAAISTLEATLLHGRSGSDRDQLYTAYIDVLSQMPDDAATHALVQQVLAGDAQYAAAALKGRPLMSFVPQLIAALPSDVKLSTNHYIHFSPYQGWIYQEHEFTLQIPEYNYSETRVYRNRHNELAIPGQKDGVNEARFSIPGRIATSANNSFNQASRLDDEVLHEQQRLDAAAAAQRQLIENALLASTNFEKEESRSGWFGQLYKALESYNPVSLPGPGPASSRQVFETASTITLRSASCFPSGTFVESLTGPVAIETLKPGDRVLSQSIDSGELAYQAVREVTLRPSVPLVEIEAGGETIRATRGHPFWVNGQAWVMAKHLKAGQYLHTPDGPLQIERIGEQPAQEAYNLVVSDFATYFVGNNKLLVHDNQPLQGTGVLVPGLAASDVPSN